MGIMDQRVLFSNAGSIADYSRQLLDFKADAATIAIASTDYLYLGSLLPLNHKFFEIETANAVVADVSVDIWYARSWVPAVDVIDYTTSAAGASLAQSGVIRWSTNRLKGWDSELDSSDVTGLTGTVINDMYWTRFSWSATLTATVAIKAVGQKFSSDADLYAEYPIFNNSVWLESWETGKTTWDEQHFIAADRIAKDLLKGGILKSKDQILDYELFNEASVHKVAEIIFSALGDAYVGSAKAARNNYLDAIKLRSFGLDKNRSGNLEEAERSIDVYRMQR